MRREQAGVSMFVVVFILVVCISFVLIGFKSAPVLNEYFSLKRIVKQLVADGGGMSIGEIKDSFVHKATIDYVTVVKPDDLVILKDGNSVNISVVYDAPVRLLGENDASHLDLMFHFEIHEGQKPSKDAVSE